MLSNHSLLPWSFCMILVTLSTLAAYRVHEYINLKRPSHQLYNNILHGYAHKHSRNVVVADTKEDFCNRNFVVAKYACPKEIGNRMHEYLNDFFLAVMTNRTLVIRFGCTKHWCEKLEPTCQALIPRKKWILTNDEFQSLAKQHSCSRPILEVVELIPELEAISSHHKLACMGLDRLPHPTVRLGMMEVHQMSALLYPKVNIISEYSLQVLDAFRQIGELELFGHFFYSTFSFNESIIQGNDKLIASAPSSGSSLTSISTANSNNHLTMFKLSVHLRHISPDDAGHLLDTTKDCIWQAVKQYRRADQDCRILLATDRRPTIAEVAHFGDRIGCPVLIAAKLNESHPDGINEHGEFSDAHSIISDIEFLSRGNAMVGSTYPSMLHLQLSTFSLISASLEQAKHHVGSTHFRNSSIFWLPTCSRAGYDGYLDGYPEFGLYPEPVPFKC